MFKTQESEDSMDYHFWIEVGIAAGTLLSMLFHHSHNKKLNDLGDTVDKIETLAGSLVTKDAK